MKLPAGRTVQKLLRRFGTGMQRSEFSSVREREMKRWTEVEERLSEWIQQDLEPEEPRGEEQAGFSHVASLSGWMDDC